MSLDTKTGKPKGGGGCGLEEKHLGGGMGAALVKEDTAYPSAVISDPLDHSAFDQESNERRDHLPNETGHIFDVQSHGDLVSEQKQQQYFAPGDAVLENPKDEESKALKDRKRKRTYAFVTRRNAIQTESKVRGPPPLTKRRSSNHLFTNIVTVGRYVCSISAAMRRRL